MHRIIIISHVSAVESKDSHLSQNNISIFIPLAAMTSSAASHNVLFHSRDNCSAAPRVHYKVHTRATPLNNILYIINGPYSRVSTATTAQLGTYFSAARKTRERRSVIKGIRRGSLKNKASSDGRSFIPIVRRCAFCPTSRWRLYCYIYIQMYIGSKDGDACVGVCKSFAGGMKQFCALSFLQREKREFSFCLGVRYTTIIAD